MHFKGPKGSDILNPSPPTPGPSAPTDEPSAPTPRPTPTPLGVLKDYLSNERDRCALLLRKAPEKVTFADCKISFAEKANGGNLSEDDWKTLRELKADKTRALFVGTAPGRITLQYVIDQI